MKPHAEGGQEDEVTVVQYVQFLSLLQTGATSTLRQGQLFEGHLHHELLGQQQSGTAGVAGQANTTGPLFPLHSVMGHDMLEASTPVGHCKYVLKAGIINCLVMTILLSFVIGVQLLRRYSECWMVVTTVSLLKAQRSSISSMCRYMLPLRVYCFCDAFNFSVHIPVSVICLCVGRTWWDPR